MRLRLFCGCTEVRAISIFYILKRVLIATLLKKPGKQIDSTAYTEPCRDLMSCGITGKYSSNFMDLPSLGHRPGEASSSCWWISKMAWLKRHLTCGSTRCVLTYMQAWWLPSGVGGGVHWGHLGDAA